MTIETEILALRGRVAELESRVDFLYNHLGIAQVQNVGMADARVIDMLKKRNKIEAIKIYRELYNCGLAEAKQAVENIESRLVIGKPTIQQTLERPSSAKEIL